MFAKTITIPQFYIWFFYFLWDVRFHSLFDQELRIGKKYWVMLFVLVCWHNIFFQSSTHDQITHIFETKKVFLFNLYRVFFYDFFPSIMTAALMFWWHFYFCSETCRTRQVASLSHNRPIVGIRFIFPEIFGT